MTYHIVILVLLDIYTKINCFDFKHFPSHFNIHKKFINELTKLKTHRK